jgi:hypothetical protein
MGDLFVYEKENRRGFPGGRLAIPAVPCVAKF